MQCEENKSDCKKGTGFIYKVSENRKKAIVLTAAHNLFTLKLDTLVQE
jgi:hypothetical protein